MAYPQTYSPPSGEVFPASNDSTPSFFSFFLGGAVGGAAYGTKVGRLRFHMAQKQCHYPLAPMAVLIRTTAVIIVKIVFIMAG